MIEIVLRLREESRGETLFAAKSKRENYNCLITYATTNWWDKKKQTKNEWNKINGVKMKYVFGHCTYLLRNINDYNVSIEKSSDWSTEDVYND